MLQNPASFNKIVFQKCLSFFDFNREREKSNKEIPDETQVININLL